MASKTLSTFSFPSEEKTEFRTHTIQGRHRFTMSEKRKQDLKKGVESVIYATLELNRSTSSRRHTQKDSRDQFENAKTSVQ